MCAFVDIKAQQKFLSKHKNHKTVTVYKVLCRKQNMLNTDYYTLVSPYINENKYFIGINKSNSRAKLQTQKNREINKGIHTFIHKCDADSLAIRNNYKNWFVVKVKAEMKDLICVGVYDEAVFKKITLPESEVKRVMSGHKYYA